MLLATTSPAPPAATPGGRARVNEPVTYTVSPMMAWLHTTPLICQVGSASAVTVGGGTSAAAASAATTGAAWAWAGSATTAMEAAARTVTPARRRARSDILLIV